MMRVEGDDDLRCSFKTHMNVNGVSDVGLDNTQ